MGVYLAAPVGAQGVGPHEDPQLPDSEISMEIVSNTFCPSPNFKLSMSTFHVEFQLLLHHDYPKSD